MDVGLVAVNTLAFVLKTPKATAVIMPTSYCGSTAGWTRPKTDFLKDRSLAIQAAKAALEGSGFALPEPIYRLRFDEGASVPVQSRQPAANRPPGCRERLRVGSRADSTAIASGCHRWPSRHDTASRRTPRDGPTRYRS